MSVTREYHFIQGLFFYHLAKLAIETRYALAKRLTYVVGSYDNCHLNGCGIVIKRDVIPLYNCITNSNKTPRQ